MAITDKERWDNCPCLCPVLSCSVLDQATLTIEAQAQTNMLLCPTVNGGKIQGRYATETESTEIELKWELNSDPT